MPFIYDFSFPYRNFSFPGKHSEEKVLYAAQQHPLVLKLRLFLSGVCLLFFILITFMIVNAYVPSGISLLINIGLLVFSSITSLFLYWWLTAVYQKTLFIITNRRLTQFIQTSPFTNFQLSLAFGQVVDTAASTHNYFQKILGMGSLFARSSAGAQGDFLVSNLQHHDDVHNWLNKLLTEYSQKADKEHALDGFRPFVPGLKGEERKKFLEGKKW